MKISQNFFSFAFLFALLLSASACNKVIDPGVINEKLQMPACLNTKIVQDSYVIRKQSQFDSLKIENNCNETLPSVDFDAYSVIAKYAEGKCKVTFERQVLANDSQLTYNYKILVEQRGKCEDIISSMNWVTVPRIPDSYTVNFTVEAK